MAIGSLLTTPTSPEAAAVVSDATPAPINTPCSQLFASYTNGARVFRLPPKTIAEIMTPSGASASSEYDELFVADTVNLELGCAAGLFDASNRFPFQSIIGSPIFLSSHHGSLLSVRPTLVYKVLLYIISKADLLVF